MSNPRTKVILRTDNEIKDIPDPVLEELRSTIPNGKTAVIDYDFRSIATEEKHLIHYQRRMEAVDEGAKRLLNAIDLQGSGRVKVNEKLKELEKNRSDALKKIENDHKERNQEIKDRLKGEIVTEGLKDRSNIKDARTGLYLKDKSDRKKIAALQAQRDKINTDVVGNIAPYQNVLEDYVKQVNKILHEDAYIPKTKIKKALGRAEEYAELSDGRPPLCTVTRFDADKEKYPAGTWLIQVEEPQDPFSDEQKEDIFWALQLIRLKEFDNPALPQWYKEMSEYEKNLFIETFKDVKSTNDITKLVPAISSKLRSIPGVANFSRHTTILMDNEGNVISKNELSRSSHVASRDMKDAALRAKTTEDNINHIIDNMLGEKANKLAQLNLDCNLDASPVILPVLMQTLITPANKMGPDAALLKDRDEAIKRIIASNPVRKVDVVVMIDGKPQIKEIEVKLEIFATNHPLNELRHYGAGTGRFGAVYIETPNNKLSTDPNQHDMQRLTKFAAQHMKKYQSIDDHLKDGRDVHLISDLPKDLSLYKDSYIVVDQKQVYYVNHDGTYSDVTMNKNNLEDFNAGIQNLNPYNDKMIHLSKHRVASVITANGGHIPPVDASRDFPLLYALVKQFNYVAPRMATEIQDKELYLSSIQQLMAREMGIPYGSCVSGKDRKGISTIYTDAMGMYFDTYGHIPPPAATGTDENVKRRENFVRLFAQIYVTRHQHENAGQNSKGADGLKTPMYYLPRDMLIAVIKLTFNKWIHKQCDRLASNNEIGKIVAGKFKKMKRSAAIFLHLAGSRKETKELLEKKMQPSPVVMGPVVIGNELDSLIQIKKLLLEKQSLINHKEINQLIECIAKKASLHALATICRDRIEGIEKSGKDHPSLEIYKAIVTLARNPDPKSKSGLKALEVLSKHTTQTPTLRNVGLR